MSFLAFPWHLFLGFLSHLCPTDWQYFAISEKCKTLHVLTATLVSSSSIIPPEYIFYPLGQQSLTVLKKFHLLCDNFCHVFRGDTSLSHSTLMLAVSALHSVWIANTFTCQLAELSHLFILLHVPTGSPVLVFVNDIFTIYFVHNCCHLEIDHSNLPCLPLYVLDPFHWDLMASEEISRVS